MNADENEAPGWMADQALYPELHSLNLEADGLRQTCLADLEFLERYEGWHELGRGGHGTVVRTRCRASGLDVALKLLMRSEADIDQHRLQAESRALARITHPCVVRTYSAFARGALTWIEMELIDGTSLANEMRRRQVEDDPWLPDRPLAIAWAAAEGLAAIHAAGVVHRDIKPDNILLPASGQPAAKLVDFGVARLLDAAATSKAARYAPGTPRYSAPELVTLGRTGPETDVYALGVTLYEIFSGGTHPFALPAGAAVVEYVHAHVQKAPVPLRSLLPELDESVADVVARALDKRPELRPSAREMADVLRSALATAQGLVSVSSVPKCVVRSGWAGARVALPIAAAGVSMLMLMGVITAWRQWRAGGSATPAAQVSGTALSPPTAPPAPLALRVPAPAARLHVTWAAPGIVGVANQGVVDLDQVTVSVAGATYRLGSVPVDEEAWVFAAGEGTVTVEGVAGDGTRVVAVLS